MKKLYFVKTGLNVYDTGFYVLAQSYAEAEEKIIKEFNYDNELRIISIKLLTEEPIL